MGSAALDLCYVACGRLDGYWELSIEPYYIAAGALIAEEGDARVTAVDGGRLSLARPCSILAASEGIHREMLEVLRG